MIWIGKLMAPLRDLLVRDLLANGLTILFVGTLVK
jgi:hypothetical protein